MGSAHRRSGQDPFDGLSARWYNAFMNTLCTRTVGLLVIVTMACGGSSTAPEPPTADPAYVAEVETWRAERLARLTSEDGWLTLIGLHWLEPGANLVGSNPGHRVTLPTEVAPETVATLELREDGTVWLEPVEGGGLTVNDEPATARALATDATGKPDRLAVGRVRFYLIARSERIGVRVKDPEAATRTGFAGIESYPVDPAWRVQARFEPYPEPRQVAIPTVLGTEDLMLATGLLHFDAAGQELTLEPYLESPDDEQFFLIFRDATSGTDTYGAGRFLSATAISEGVTILDFNLAYSPPCAFTPYATCPLPPPQNWLPVAVTAGEQYHGPAH